MNKLIYLILIPIMLIVVLVALVFAQGCQSPDVVGLSLKPPREMLLWQEVISAANPRSPQLDQEGGDIALEGFGNLLGFYAIPDEDWQVLSVDWADGVLGFYNLNLHTRSIQNIGGIHIKGPQPKIETFTWPWLLLSCSDDEGNYAWILVDIENATEIAWQSHAWVPQALRRRPLWHSGESWYIGPVSGPYITDALQGTKVMGNPKHQIVNPVTETWPSWAGGIINSHWYMYPVEGGGSALVDLRTGLERLLPQDQEFAWNPQRTQVAWLQDGVLGILTPKGKSTVLITTNPVPGAPLWSDTGDILYFLGGEDNYFGTTWRALWSWDQETNSQCLVDLPGNWSRWRLLAASSEAVLASAGGSGEQLVYFDVTNGQVHQLNSADQYLWQDGGLIVLQGGDVLRLNPGKEVRVLAREAEDQQLLALVNRFFIYSHGGKVYVKQLTQ